MLIQLSQATPLQIDWTVAQILKKIVYVVDGVLLEPPTEASAAKVFNPTSNPIQAYEIMFAEKIGFDYSVDRWFSGVAGTMIMHEGPTPLIAAMRAFIEYKCGKVIGVPDDLA